MAKVTTIADITTAVSKGRMFTDARNALIVYAVIVEKTTRSAIVAATGVDAGDVSRVVKQANESAEARAAVESLTRTGSESARMEAAAAVGSRFFRRVRKTKTTAPKGGKSGGTATGSRNPSTGPLADSNESNGTNESNESNTMSPADILAALAVLRDAARRVKFSDDQSAELSVYAMELADIAAN